MANWRTLFPARILSRGEIYYDNLMIKSFDLAQDNEHFAATIQGGPVDIFVIKEVHPKI